jgi:hypothetical protein
MRALSKTALPAAALVVCLTLAPLSALRAEDQAPAPPPGESPSEIAREGLEKMLRALRLLVESIPQYELPEVLENGDIIIRRKRPDSESEEPEFDETAT